MPPIAEWTPLQVSEFLARIGFPEASKIAIYNKIDGDRIKTFDEEIFINTFGIVGINEIQKVRFEIGES